MTNDALTLFNQAKNSGQPLRGLDLSGQTLTNERLSGLVFDHCSLVGVTFSDTQLADCVFLDCDLTGANFVGDSFYRVRFESPLTKVNLSRASLNSCVLANGEFQDVSLALATVFECDFGPKARFVKSVFSSAVVANCQFGQAVFQGCALDLLVVKDTSFGSLSLIDSVAVQLQAAGLRLPKFSVQGTDLALANFSQSDLSGAKLAGMSLAGAFFKETLLVGANLSEAKAAKAIFKGADLSHADLSRFSAPLSDFSRAKLTQAKLSGADFSGAKLHRVQDLDSLASFKAEGASYTDEELARAEDFRPSLVI
ncbi:MAG: pentapeptide repeat-containing protein [Deltaproteobacteria bacterium]|jgi:uncharacterized protein YjbI with pentapeptide repeats|nr:pentapeptide repeat-containing protein [Deltaproteobacteria bacterium]